jgi:hypothetical protein
MSRRWCPGWLVVALCAGSLFAQDAPGPESFVAKLGDTNERAAAREQLLALGAHAVPAMTTALATANEALCGELLTVLTAMGPRAGAAVPAVLALLDSRPRGDAQIVSTLAELVPWRAADVDVDPAAVQRSVSQARMKNRQSPEANAADIEASQRLRVRLAFPRNLDVATLVAQLRANQPLRVELAAEFVGTHGAAAAAAVPMLRTILTRREPRVVGTERTVPLHRKAATALLAIAPGGDDAELARAVLAGRGPKLIAEVRELPPRLRTRIAELVGELAVPDTRPAAIANLVALGEPTALPVVATLSAPVDDATVAAALATLRELGAHAAPAVPDLVEALTSLSATHTVDAMLTLAHVIPWATDQVPSPTVSSSVGSARIFGKAIRGEIDCEFLTRFSAANAVLTASINVDPQGSVAEFEAHLASPSVAVRECALRVLAVRGAAARPLLPAVAAMLHAPQPKRSSVLWLDRGRVTSQRIDCTADVQRLAAAAILAVADRGDPLCAQARAVMAQPEAK